MSQSETDARAQLLIEFFDLAPMKHTFGMVLSYDSDGNAHFEMPHQERFQHAMKDTHGGVIATLLDNAGWSSLAHLSARRSSRISRRRRACLRRWQ